MDILRDWIKKEGKAGRKRLIEAFQARLTAFYPPCIMQYASGFRIPDKDRAEIIAAVVNCPLDKLVYRYVNRPNQDGHPQGDILRAWVKKEGAQGRGLLLAALQLRFPTTHSMSITNYLKPRGSKGSRIPDKERAEIMAEVMGVPVDALVYRHVHIPDNESPDASHG